jgi:signal transduction histidine kinase
MKKETSCINAAAVLDYMQVYGKVAPQDFIQDIAPELAHLPDPVGFLNDANNWIASELLSRMFTKARYLLGDEQAPFHIGRHTVESRQFSRRQRVLLGMIASHPQALVQAQKINDRWNRNKRIELVRLRDDSAVIRLHWDPHMAVTRDTCLHTQGVCTYLPHFWGDPPIDLEERGCFFEDAPYCEYHLRWTPRGKCRQILSGLLTRRSLLRDVIRKMEEDRVVIDAKYREIDRLNRLFDDKIRQISAIQEAGQALLTVLDLNGLAKVILETIRNVCRVDRAAILVVGECAQKLEFLCGTDWEEQGGTRDMGRQIDVDQRPNLLTRVVNLGQAESTLRVQEALPGGIVPESFRKELSAVYAMPLITRSRVIGVLVAGQTGGEAWEKHQLEMLDLFAPQFAISIENARLYTKQQDQVEALQRSHVLLERASKFSSLGHLAAKLAHEIKNPMTAISAFLQMLPAKWHDDSFRTTFYQVAYGESQRINDLIANLLDLGQAAPAKIVPVDLAALIEKLVVLLTPLADQKKIAFNCELDGELPEMLLDPDKIHQALLNILDNALAVAPQETAVRIAIRNARHDFLRGRPAVAVEIADSGPGIPKELQARIFDPYFSTRQRGAECHGAGLGLYIAQRHIQDHGGILEVTSSPGEGSVFTVVLPLERRKPS